jgi:hypothetical protein
MLLMSRLLDMHNSQALLEYQTWLLHEDYGRLAHIAQLVALHDDGLPAWWLAEACSRR